MSFVAFNFAYFEFTLPRSIIALKTSNLTHRSCKDTLVDTEGGRMSLELSKNPQSIIAVWFIWKCPQKAPLIRLPSILPHPDLLSEESSIYKALSKTFSDNYLQSQLSKVEKQVKGLPKNWTRKSEKWDTHSGLWKAPTYYWGSR